PPRSSRGPHGTPLPPTYKRNRTRFHPSGPRRRRSGSVERGGGDRQDHVWFRARRTRIARRARAWARPTGSAVGRWRAGRGGKWGASHPRSRFAYSRAQQARGSVAVIEVPTADEVTRLRQVADRIRTNVASVMSGRSELVRTTVAVLLAEGHLLLEDVPGVGKTTLAKALARSVDCTVGRIQFTPDLLPSD